MKLDYDGGAGLKPLDPSGARQVSEARDDEEYWLKIKNGSPLSSFARETDKIHSAYARRAPFVAYATFPPFGGGIAPNRESLKVRDRHARGRRPYVENTDNQLIDILLVFELNKTVALRRQSFSSVRTEISCFCVLCGRAEWL